jgi:excisionase family DNA binding protein
MHTSTDVDPEDAARAPDPLLVTPRQAGIALSICRTKVYELIRRGQLESVQIGASRRIPSAALSDYVQRLREASS